jgi:hypothetical protein
MKFKGPNVPPSNISDPLGRMILFAALAMLTLSVLRIVLTLPGNVGPEDFLGFVPHGIQGRELASIAQAWERLVVFAMGAIHSDLRAMALAYLSLDTALFVPLYVSLLLEIARRINGRAAVLIACLTLFLMTMDIIENGSGLAKMGLVFEQRAVALCLEVSSIFAGFLFWKSQTLGDRILDDLVELYGRRVRICWYVGILLAAVGCIAAGLFALIPGTSEWTMQICAVSHSLKVWIEWAVICALAAYGGWWLFRSTTSGADLGAVRRGMADILGRTRYVLLILAVFAGLTLVMDQCRDVSIAVADGMFSWPEAISAWPCFLLSVLAVWALSFSCWLWARLACRMPGPAATQRTAMTISADQTLQAAARGFARLLGLVPPFVAALMSAYAMRDSTWAASPPFGTAARQATSDAVFSPILLLVFGAASVFGGLLFLWSRESATMASGSQTYYDDETLIEDGLLVIAKEKYRFIAQWGPGPTWLAIWALGLAVLTRGITVIWQPGVPFAFVVIVLMLVAWLGLLGVISLKERREARPWVLIFIAITGVLGYGGFTENHRVRIIETAGSGALPDRGYQVFATILLMVCVMFTAWKLVQKAVGNNRIGWRWGWVVLSAAAVGSLIVWGFSYLTQPGSKLPGSRVRPTPEVVFGNWADSLWNDTTVLKRKGDPVFLVTSEGGGMRAAYWTAKALEGLQQKVPQFNERTLMLSGVSGGAVGEAVYIGCSLHNSAESLSNCIQHFGATDVLTPMIGAWLFEDALARVLPTSVPKWIEKRWKQPCSQPGCGLMSRGLWFEQALETAVPGLKQGIGSIAANEGPRLPQLFLNSTWVESGDRAIASGVIVDWKTDFPEARDQISFAAGGDDKAADLPLSAAAHNSGRFPFVNALGALRAPGGTDSGHLADGGYFDNSGSHTVLDVLAAFNRWRTLRCTDQTADSCAWLMNLHPRILVIQNGITVDCKKEPNEAKLLDCLRREWQIAPPLPNTKYQPYAPAAAARLALFADLAGPLVTVVNVSGTGANGRRAAALLMQSRERFAVCAEDWIVQVGQRTDGLLYPLGWYLSPTARKALDREATIELERQLNAGPSCSSGP